jgi:hypothetical protein
MRKSSTFPDGIGESNQRPVGGARLTVLRAVLVGAVLLAALFGVVGGAPTAERRVETPAAAMRVHVPNPIRNGMFVEWRVAVSARQPIGDAVIAISAPLWEDMTINSLVPAASEEKYKGGDFLFHFGPLEQGEPLLFKIDGQVNPPSLGARRGKIRLLDGERELAAMPIELKVIP